MGQLASALTTRAAFSALPMPKRGAMTRQARIERDVRLGLDEATLAELHGGDRVIARLKWQVSLLGSHKALALAGRPVRTEKRCVRQRERLRRGVPLGSSPAPAGAERPKSPSPEGVGGPTPGVGLLGWSRGFP